jgi:hypothetical protein
MLYKNKCQINKRKTIYDEIKVWEKDQLNKYREGRHTYHQYVEKEQQHLEARKNKFEKRRGGSRKWKKSRISLAFEDGFVMKREVKCVSDLDRKLRQKHSSGGHIKYLLFPLTHCIYRNRARLFQQNRSEDYLCPNPACRRAED